MIEELRISGVGVIDSAQMDLSEGFTVITGETGAGKTMVLTALRLLLGEKAQTALVQKGRRQMEVDGVLAVPGTVRAQMEELGLSTDGELIVSRTVPAEGRGRIAAQGRPVPARTLQELVGPLITIHGQSDQWNVRRSNVQRDVLDLYAGGTHADMLAQYRLAWSRLVQASERLEKLHQEHDQREIEVRYLAEVVAAIEDLDPEPDEEVDLARQIDRLANAAELSEEVTGAFLALHGEDVRDGVGDTLGRTSQTLHQLGAVDPGLEVLASRLEQAEAEVADVAAELRGYVDLLEEDPSQLARLQQRRADLESLMKGRATTATELLDWLMSARERLSELSGEDTDPEKVAQVLAEAKAAVLQLGTDLSMSRARAGLALADAVNGELGALAMPGASFRVHIQEEEPGPFGLDRISLDLQARPDGPFRPIGEGASGGEISRVMLALELALGQRKSPGTYVFDEVDQGIGGHTATEVGRRLGLLAESQQVIAVTHLPQVAAFADRHFVLSRDGDLTDVSLVQGHARVEEIMRMMGAKSDSVSGRRHAEELLNTKRDKIVPGADPEGLSGERK